MSFRKKVSSGFSDAFIAATLAAVGPAAAADWSFDAGLGNTLLFESNRNLDIPRPGPVYGLLSDVSLALAAAGKTVDFGLSANVSYPAYAGTDPPPNDLQWSTTAGITKRTQLSTYSLTGAFSRQDATTTEELEDVGIITTNAQRVSSSLTAAYSHQLNRHNSVSLSADASSTRFNGTTGSLVGSDNFDITGTWQHDLTKLSSLNVTLGYSLFDPTDPGSVDAELYTVSAGLSSNITRRLSVSGSAGVTIVDSATGDPSAGFNANIGVNYTAKSTALSLGASHGARPSSFGEVQTTTAVTLNLDHAINETSRFGLGASYSSFSSSSPTRNLLVVSPSYSRQLSDRVSASLAYTFTMDRDGGGTATANSLMMKLTTELVNIP